MNQAVMRAGISSKKASTSKSGSSSGYNFTSISSSGITYVATKILNLIILKAIIQKALSKSPPKFTPRSGAHTPY